MGQLFVNSTSFSYRDLNQNPHRASQIDDFVGRNNEEVCLWLISDWTITTLVSTLSLFYQKRHLLLRNECDLVHCDRLRVLLTITIAIPLSTFYRVYCSSRCHFYSKQRVCWGHNPSVPQCEPVKKSRKLWPSVLFAVQLGCFGDQSRAVDFHK